MRFASLGSGSSGNALVVECNDTRLLLDCGFGLRESAFRLARLDLDPSQITAVLVTHEHDDHAGGAFRFSARHGIPIWLTHGTMRGAASYIPKSFNAPVQVIDGLSPLAIGDIEVHPYPVPHDAEEPVQFAFSDGARTLGVLTDTGCSTPHIESMLNGCHALALECNHDVEMLKNGSYAWPLKQRILGRLGHLDNASAANLLGKLDTGRLQHIVAMHLSEKNNTPELARSSLADALNCEHDWIGIASQTEGFGWRQIR